MADQQTEIAPDDRCTHSACRSPRCPDHGLLGEFDRRYPSFSDDLAVALAEPNPPAQTDPKEVGRGAHRHCDCTRLCDMGPTCSLAPPDLPGAGCFRVQPYPPVLPGDRLDVKEV